MAAIEFEAAGGREASAARWLRGLMALGAVTIVLASVRYAIAMAYDMDDPNEGNPWDLEAWEWALLAAPLLLPLVVAVLLIAAGAKRLEGLRTGEDRARRAVNSLAYASAAGTGLFAAYVFWSFGFGESGFGPRTSAPGVFFGSLGDMNPVGWIGLVGFVGLVALFAGSVVLAVLTQRSRD
ncbi:hypothetical protein [Glycomyces algeriensis]|uniref:Uncharacterized protein n=1 Tax=Glycomyces algeriensis TaxID=256037 RepID=A0A9W6LJ19_9ACTN|nr:hypothetical protein [Glycomyces algeriensis]MDA1365842.1 hypothetical protein [Glycomyces algeriensis]MDR7351531.1 hypothetical protein [Glycomyces algeriensis]GLI44251.1 hypothetical protein GALLR39Z86_41010 [Glycomyces algeriensis]